MLLRYAFTVLTVAFATFFRFALDPFLGLKAPFILYFPMVVLCAWFGGLWPGVISAILSALIAWYIFFPPQFSFTVSDPSAPTQLIVFMLAGVLISLLAESLHRARRRTEESEAKEREQRERLRVTLESIGDAVIATDTQGCVTFVNSVTESLTGWNQAEATGKPLEEVFKIINAQTRQPAENPVARVLREGKVVGLANHTRLIARDGSEIAIDDSAAPIVNEGNLVGVILVFRDATERNRADQERAELLESEHAARTQAEAASHAKDEFLATVSHELRTPLTAILGWARLLSIGDIHGKNARKAVETIERNAKAQAQLIEDLLDMSRIISGKLRLTFEPVNLAKAIETALESVRPTAQAKSIQLTANLDSAVGMVIGDSIRLQQIIWNLLSNAVKFTPKGGRVVVRLVRDNSQAQIVISDTGKGISAEFLPHCFSVSNRLIPETRANKADWGSV